jgi:hypothetical protein
MASVKNLQDDIAKVQRKIAELEAAGKLDKAANKRAKLAALQAQLDIKLAKKETKQVKKQATTQAEKEQATAQLQSDIDAIKAGLSEDEYKKFKKLQSRAHKTDSFSIGPLSIGGDVGASLDSFAKTLGLNETLTTAFILTNPATAAAAAGASATAKGGAKLIGKLFGDPFDFGGAGTGLVPDLEKETEELEEAKEEILQSIEDIDLIAGFEKRKARISRSRRRGRESTILTT